ncbi:hypothetical protein CTAYLR_001655 [Chrysophaeum taylorii]|uniref:ABC transporter domain-containing protein n=1 Tax=Chrysophaeum taylorii TaxID=2483200 RepID=A0AAD7XHV8_9STRA|nr:hypothetical protein CTAYLR_001655 [Chrysophaeum taylorii]
MDSISETKLEAIGVGYEVSGKTILSDVTTRFEPRQVTAIMGPSGAGKSSLLAVLGGRAAGTITGQVVANGVPVSPQRVRSMLSHMPQDDIMYTELTVRQTLYYAALLRSPRTWSQDTKLERADHIMMTLGMERVIDSRVSDVSGGQRKRASAAMEFLSVRPVLSMDEPTSGLDAATASALVQRLVTAANQEGRTVLCTIHQPAWSLVERFNRLVVLAPVDDQRGGMIVFDAEPASLPRFIERVSSTMASEENAADTMLYALQRDGAVKWRNEWTATTLYKDAIARASTTTKAGGVAKAAAAALVQDDPTEDLTTFLLLKVDNNQQEGTGGGGKKCSRVVDALFELSQSDEYPISQFQQYLVLFFRALHVYIVDPAQGRLMATILAIYTLLMVAMLHGMPPNFSKINGCVSYFLTQYSMTMLPLIVLMPLEKRVVVREFRNGAFSVAPYWCARVTLGCTHATFVATVATIVYPLYGFPVTPLAPKLIRWWCAQFLFIACVMIFALTIGILTPSPLAGIKAVVAFMMPWLVSSGTVPPLHLIRPVAYPFHWPNPFSWAFKLLLCISFTSRGDKASEVLEGSDYLAMNCGNANSCFYALAIFFAATFVLGLGLTHRALKSSDKSAGRTQPNKKKPSPKSVILPSEDEEVGRAKKKQPAATEATQDNPLVTAAAATTTTTARVPRESGADEEAAAAVPTAVAAGASYAPVRIALRDVTYRRKSKPDKPALEGVTMTIEPAALVALMGPSGAGKSTLLRLLAGQLRDGFVDGPGGTKLKLLQGQVLVDGHPMNAKGFRAVGTLTPQDDFVPTVLTVRQVLTYTAELRLAATTVEREAAVVAVMRELGLAKIADNVVGDETKVGISGGQKKRLSVAIDLLANRPIMLIDEPTTGLDAAAAADVVQALERLSKSQRRTIIASIHQPPWALMQRFEQLLLLASGRVIFNGPPAGVPEFFASGGSPVPPNENPLDHVMFVLQAEGAPKWTAHYVAHKLSSPGGDDDAAGLFRGSAENDAPPLEYPVSELEQWWTLVRRTARVFFADEDQFMELLIPGCINNMISGFAFFSFPTNWFLPQAITISLCGLSMMMLNGLVLSIPVERQIVVREFGNGTYSMRAFWFARCAVSLLAVAIFAPIFTVIWYAMVGLSSDPHVVFTVFFSSLLSAADFAILANIIGVVANTQLRAAQICDPFSLSATLFSGTIVTRRFIKDFLKPIYYLVPISYASENCLTAVLEDKGEMGQTLLAYLHFHPSNRPFNYACMLAILAALLLAGLFFADRTIGAISTSE